MTDDVTYDMVHVHRGGGADFSEHMDQVAACGRLHGRMGVRVLRQQRVENTVCNMVAQLVGMSLGDAFGRNKMHWSNPFGRSLGFRMRPR